MSIEFSDYFVYDENSPSGLSTLNGRNVGYQKTDKNLKYWRTMKLKSPFMFIV